MANYEQIAPNGKTYSLVGPAGASKAEVLAEILRVHPEASKPSMSGIIATLSGIERGARPVANFMRAANPLSYVEDALFGVPKSRNAMEKRMAAIGAQAQAAQPDYYNTGKMAGSFGSEAALFAPVTAAGGALISGGGKLLTKIAPRVGPVVRRVGEAISSGGIGTGRTAAETAALKFVPKAKRLAERVVGGSAAGAAGGAGSAALEGKDVREGATTGAAFGAGLPIVGTIVRRLGGRGKDILQGNMPKLKAAQIIREALGENIDKARAAFAALSPDDKRLAQQVLIDAGIEPDVYMGLGKIAGKVTPEQTRIAQETAAAARNKTLTQAAGSEDATQARIAAELGRKNVETTFGPTRKNILSEQQGVNETVQGLQQQGAAATQQAADEAARARRFAFGANRAEMGVGQADDLGDVFNPAAVNQQRGLAGAMGQRSETAATNAIDLRQSADDIQDQIARMALQGEKPTEAGPIITALRTRADTPGIRASDEQVAVLSGLADKIESLASRNGGLIHPQDLYQLRKTSANDVVGRLMAGAQPSSGVKQATAGHVIDFKDMVDTALGQPWRDVMAKASSAYEGVTRQKLAAHLSDLARDKPDEFVEVMRGRKPEVVEGIMGEGKFDIGKIMSSDPAMFAPFGEAAKNLSSIARMNVLGTSGSHAANEMMYKDRGNLATRGLTGLVGAFTGSPTRIGAQGAELMGSSYMAPRVNAALGESFLSGRNALNAMNQYPSSSLFADKLNRMSPITRSAISQTLPKLGQFDFSQFNE
jgi:hypothetical protein